MCSQETSQLVIIEWVWFIVVWRVYIACKPYAMIIVNLNIKNLTVWLMKEQESAKPIYFSKFFINHFLI